MSIQKNGILLYYNNFPQKHNALLTFLTKPKQASIQYSL